MIILLLSLSFPLPILRFLVLVSLRLSHTPTHTYNSYIANIMGIKAFREAIRKSLDVPTYSLTHALLAKLPCKEVVTTNQDRCYENACESIELKVCVLPKSSLDCERRYYACVCVCMYVYVCVQVSVFE